MSYVLAFLLLVGSFFVLVAGLGVARLPDFFCRMHAAAKAGAFGGALLAIATAVAAGHAWGWIDAAVLVLFFYVTTPVASHLLARAAYLRRVKLWERTGSDEYQPYIEKMREEMPPESPQKQPGAASRPS
jgi:multicomponent Na+:H+ antiporter subunit G